MKQISQKHLMDTTFARSIQREELLMKKYEDYYELIENKELKALLKEFKKNAKDHLRLINEMIANMNLQG
ncbi:MAG: hypothetical protein ACOYVK_06945 [Bacillota bacterium]